MALRTVGVRLVAEVSDYTRNMKQAGKTARDFSGELGQAAKAGRLDAVADQATGMGIALAGVAGSAIKLSMDFEKSMSAVSAATHASAGDLEQLRKAAITAGKDTQYSATEAADAITELSKAGVSTADVLGGGLNGALDLAAAGQLDVAEAAETAASAMVQFKLDGKDVPHIADLLAAGAGKAQGSVHDMGQALNQAGLIASQTGLSIEETTGGLAAFANAGLIGSDAGTSFKQMLLMLQSPSDKAKAQMDDLGITLYDNQGKFIGLSKFAGQLRESLKTLTPEARSAALAQIFGADATRAASIVYENGADGIQGWIDKVNDSGYASETAAKLTDNLAGDLERLKGSFETLAIESGGGANSGLRVVTKSVNALVDQFGQLPSAIGGTVTILAGLGGVLALGAAGWVKMRRSNAEALEELRNTGPAGERAANGLQKTQKWASRAAIAFAAAQIAAAGVSAAFGTDLNPQTEALAQNLEQWAISGDKAGEATRLLGDNFQHLGYDLSTLDGGFWAGLGNGIAGVTESFTGMGDVADESLTHAKERIGALDTALTQLVQQGKTETAALVFKKLADEAQKSGVNVDELKKGLPQYTAALQTAGSATSDTATSVTNLGDAADTSAEDLDKLTKALKEAFDQQMSADRAAIKLEQSTVSLAKELGEGAKTLALNSDEGRKNREAVLDQLAAIEDLREARVDEGMAVDDASRKYVKDVDGLRKSMIQAGFSKKAVDELIGSYRNIPSKVNTQISTPGLAAADKAVQDYDKRIDNLARYIRTTVSVEGRDRAQKQLEELLILQQAAKKGISVSAAASAFRKNAGYHDGGWTGPGGEYEPAGVVHGDEYVIRKSSRQKIEATAPGLLDEMNATGQVPGYARGGKVLRMPFPVSAAGTKVPSREQALSVVVPQFSSGDWPSSPSAQRGDSGVWHKVVALIKSTGPLSGSFGNAYRPGDPLWHGSGRAVDWMGYNQDALATFLSHQRPLELIHRTKHRDYAYTRGRDKGSFNNALMEAHRNHIHIAMARGGTINEPVMGVGASGRTYSFGENYQPERVVPNWQPAVGGAGSGGGNTYQITVNPTPLAHPADIGRQVVAAIKEYERGSGPRWRTGG